MKEQAIVLGVSRSLVGVLTEPDRAPDPARPALIVVNAGRVHRVGPQRLHVQLLRRMASRGFVGLRFDFSGIGDSLPRADLMPYVQSTLLEVGDAMDAVTAATGVRRFCVIGLSSGALVAMACAGADARVAGVCLLNPHGFAESSVWGEHVESLAAGQEYARNLTSLHSWRKLLTGKTNYRRMFESLRYRVVGDRRHEQELSQVADGTRPGLLGFFEHALPTLMVFSQKDRSQQNFEQILGRGWQRRVGDHVRIVEIADANHTFASPPHLREALQALDDWLQHAWPANAADDPAAGAPTIGSDGARARRPAEATLGGPHGI